MLLNTLIFPIKGQCKSMRTISFDQPAIMCMKTGYKFISDKIDSLGDFNVRPDGMEIDLDSKLYYK